MALFGNGGFFDEFLSSVKKNPVENLLTGGLVGAYKGFKSNPQDLLLPGAQDTLELTGRGVGEGIKSFGEGFMAADALGAFSFADGQTSVQSEVGLKDSLRAENELNKARRARASAGNVLTSTNAAPSLLG